MRRGDLLARLRERPAYDLVVIGGGATGLGTALDASVRGYRVAVLEAFDFAQATSSRSTKLVHGGVRYLAQGRLGLVREALRERSRLARNAPHLVHARPFLVPAYRWGERSYYGLGLKLYDLLAGDLAWGGARRIGRLEALEAVPTLAPEGLRGGVVYHDGQFDDARLAIALMRTVLDRGGLAVNYLRVTALRHRAGRVAGVEARDDETGETFELEAKAVVNATGVFADEVRRLDDPAAASLLAPSQGAHLVLDRSFLPGEMALLVPKTDDGRVLFAIPWQGRTLVGTTETPVAEPVVEPRPFPEEIAFLRRHAARYLSRPIEPSDVRSAFAGLRPLLGRRRPDARSATARLSREHAVVVAPSGLVTITGGKWTTYRTMGATAVEQAARVGGLPARPEATADLKLHGSPAEPVAGPLAAYGAEAPALERLMAETPEWAVPLVSNLPEPSAVAVWAARFELARTVEDVLARRTRALFLDARASQDAAPRVAALLAGELGRDRAWQEEQVRQFRALADGYRLDDVS